MSSKLEKIVKNVSTDGIINLAFIYYLFLLCLYYQLVSWPIWYFNQK